MRDKMGSQAYWDRWVIYVDKQQEQDLETIRKPSGNPQYRPQFIYEMSSGHLEQMLRRYSRGDDVATLASEIAPLIDLWEEAERIGKDVWTADQQLTRHSWEKNLDFYISSFWLVGLSLTLDVAQPLWERLLALIGNEGEDALLDRIIATRQSGRRIGNKLCHPLPYRRLLAAVNAQQETEKALLLRDFVEHWYAELDRLPKKGLSRDTAVYERPYWYEFGDRNFDGGAYFGRWCIEAVAAVKAFGFNDGLCLGHPAYPGDLLRPFGPSTHVNVEVVSLPVIADNVISGNRKGWIRRLLNL
jgi:hypothetical protein